MNKGKEATLQKLLEEYSKIKKALDKACEMLSKMLNWDCPVARDLINDLDCENNCTDDYEQCVKRCWKKYLLEEVVSNEKNDI